METGLFFALLSAGTFGGSLIFLRRGVHLTGESFTAVQIGLFIGTLLFAFLLSVSAEWGKVWSVSWQGFLLLGTAGIIHYIVGRLLAYTSVRLIGANKTNVMLKTSSLYAVTFGVIFLNESLTVFLVLGVLCIIAGVTLVGFEKEGEISKIRSKAILSALSAALFWGISGVLIKAALGEIGSPFAAAFISYFVAFILGAGFLFRKGQREQLIRLRRTALIPLVISGVLISTGQLFRFIALSYSPVSIVQPLLSTDVFFVFLFSFLLNRKIEVFTWKIFIGLVLTLAGAVLLSR